MIFTQKELPGRRPYDLYPTPQWLAEAALEGIQAPPESVLDAGAGEGIWGQAARQKWPHSLIHGVEIQESRCPRDYSGWWVADFLEQRLCKQDLIMGNPPYNQAEAFIEKAETLLNRGGEVVFLLRLAFLAGQKRRDGLFKRWPPRHVAVCSKRPSFNADGRGTNATDFAVLYWTLGHRGPTTVGWL